MADACPFYPDIFKPSPDGASDDQKGAIAPENSNRIKFYTAVRFLLLNRFGFPEAIPQPPTFPPAGGALPDVLGTMSDDGRIYFVSVAGLLISENFVDPL